MKRMKKMVSLALALIMAFAMTITAFADETPRTITVNSVKGDAVEHTYNAYQIFSGDLATVEGKEVLSNIEWGSGVNADTLLEALLADEDIGQYFAGCDSAAAVAAVLGDSEKFPSSVGAQNDNGTGATTTNADIFARIVENNLSDKVAGTESGVGSVSIRVVGSGYYLVKDVTEGLAANSARTRLLLEVTGNPTVSVKATIPGGTKEVYQAESGTINTGDANTAFIINGNSPVGAHVSYKITSTVPNYVGYNWYYFIMNDTLDEGLDLDEGSFKVTVDGKEIEKGSDYYVYTGEDAKVTIGDETKEYSFRLAFDNIMDKNADGTYKYKVGDEIVVTYSATVNDKATAGIVGNKNTWNLTFPNDPDYTFDNDREDGEDTPGLPKDENDDVFGRTPDDITLTYIAQLDILKVRDNENGAPLKDVEFTITGTSYQVVLNQMEYFEAITDDVEEGKDVYYLLKNGTYTTEAPVGATYEEDGTGDENTRQGYIKNSEGEYVVPADVKEYIGQTIYKLVGGTADNYVDGTMYELKQATVETRVPTKVSMQATTDSEGKISFKGLGVGEYTLTETKTPAGFNTLDPVKITISCTVPEKVSTGKEPCTWTVKSSNDEIVKLTVDGTTGFINTKVVNKSGSLLPSTGGIGTTIFYVVGGILVIGAGILLVAKKRMGKN